jgi:hypothetical protein
MTEHVWHWQSAEEHPEGWVYDADGWYACIKCGAGDRGVEVPQIAGCPRNKPTAVVCTCRPPVHSVQVVNNRPVSFRELSQQP